MKGENMRHAIKKIIDENGKEILLNRTKFMNSLPRDRHHAVFYII